MKYTKYTFIILCLFFAYSNSKAQTDISFDKKSVYLLAIGIKDFNEKSIKSLHSVDTIKYRKSFDTISKDYLRLSYENHPVPFLLNNYVEKKTIIETLKSLSDSVDESSVVIISALSHGVIDETSGDYYFICSDTQSNDYAKTAISGKDLRSYFEKMANKGAIVLVFWDTCYSGALFDNCDFTPKSNGAIIYFASSQKNQISKQIENRCKFTETLIDCFLNNNKSIFSHGVATIGSFKGFLPEGVKREVDTLTQKPISKSFSNDPNIDEIPIIKEKKLIPWGAIWKHPEVFSPTKVSPNTSKWIDYGLIGIGGLSLAGMIICGPILQTYYKDKISKETNAFKRNEYRRYGKNASIGFCVCSGLLVSSYIARTMHVHHQLSLEHRERQFVKLDITPVVSTDYNGFAFVFNF